MSLNECVHVLKVAKYRVGVQQMGSQMSVRELGYTRRVPAARGHPVLLGSQKTPALGPGEAAGGDSSVLGEAPALRSVEPRLLLCSVLARIPACSTPKVCLAFPTGLTAG